MTFRANRLPAWGETLFGTSFQVSAGGKGSNQAIAAVRLGAAVTFIARIGQDTFGELARRTWAQEGIDTRFVVDTPDQPTGAASVVVDETTGENAIVVVPGAGLTLTCDDVDRAREVIENSSALLLQLELPLDVVRHALEIARESGVRTILNPAPAVALDPQLYTLCDYLTPNEFEASALCGQPLGDVGVQNVAARLRSLGAGTVIVTLGSNGAWIESALVSRQVSAVDAGPVIETTGAGDAFNGAFAVGLNEGMPVVEATRFACAAAGLSVTRAGTAMSMPRREDVNVAMRHLARLPTPAAPNKVAVE